MLEIPVDLGARRYAISVGHGLSRRLPDVLEVLRGRQTVVVASRRVWDLHGGAVGRSLRGLGPTRVRLVPDGERHKGRVSLESLYDAFLAARLGRDGLVVALGGGVVGDLAGYAAATWMRGVDWVVVPTTLLSMVDSSIGGKVGINHPRAKNMIGAFHQPRAVVIDPSFLDTLAPRQLRSGAYEILKCAILGDPGLFGTLRNSPPDVRAWDRDTVEKAIATACRIKAEVVGSDERESGLRRVLNLGHTIGHALEAVTRYRRFTHGEAVGWGTIGAAVIARGRGLLGEPDFDAIASAVDGIGPRPRVSDLRTEAVLEALARDKKARRGRVPFVLPVAIGRVEIHDDVTRPQVVRALEALGDRERLNPSGSRGRPSGRGGGSRPRRRRPTAGRR